MNPSQNLPQFIQHYASLKCYPMGVVGKPRNISLSFLSSLLKHRARGSSSRCGAGPKSHGSIRCSVLCARRDQRIDPGGRFIVPRSVRRIVKQIIIYYNVFTFRTKQKLRRVVCNAPLLPFYKPVGCVSARKDAEHTTVMDYFPSELRETLFPLGRLDKNTEGLLLITDDGKLNHRLLDPENHIEKQYLLWAAGTLGEVSSTSCAPASTSRVCRNRQSPPGWRCWNGRAG